MNIQQVTVGKRVVAKLPGKRFGVLCQVVDIYDTEGIRAQSVHVREINSGKSRYVSADQLAPVRPVRA